ncbi:MAG: hypothetical protein AAGL96_01660 [Pseudomonadota bacterium]
MKGLQDITFENETKIRKAIVSISVVTLVFANVELASNTLDFFGLKIVVSLEKTVAVLRLVLLLLLAALMLTLLERLPRLVAKVMRIRDERWWEKLLPDLEAFQRGTYQSEEDAYNEFQRENPELDDILYMKKHQRSENRKKVLGYFRPIAMFSRSVTQYVFPISIALVALFFPHLVLVLG